MRVGIVGIGFMGWIHYLAYQQCQNADVVAFCSGNAAKRRGDWTGIRGNFGPAGRQIDVSSMNVYESLGPLLDDPQVEWVDLCLPPHLHAAAIEKSLQAGKRVLCEKPLTLTAAEAHRLTTLAGDDLLVAHILPFMNEYDFLVAAVRDDRFGTLRSMRLKRFISPPDWIPDFYDRSKIGGPLIDLHVHDAHLIRLLMGQPDDVRTGRMNGLDSGGQPIPRCYESLMTYADGRFVSSGGGVIEAPGRTFTHGYEAHFDRATVQFEFAAYTDDTNESIPLTVLHKDGSIDRPDLGDGDPVQAFVRQARAAAEYAAGNSRHPALDPKIAADALTLCERQDEPAR